jgi:hypothetical protein
MVEELLQPAAEQVFEVFKVLVFHPVHLAEKVIGQRYQKQPTPSTVRIGVFFIPERPIFFKSFLSRASADADERRILPARA